MSGEKQGVDDFKIRELTPAEASLDLARVRDVGLTVLPSRRTDDGKGIYAQGQADVVKQLRSEGIDVEFLDEPRGRVFEAKYGFMTDVAIPYLFGVATNGGWAALAALAQRLRGRGSNNMIRITAMEAETGKAWLLEGPAARMPEAIEQIKREQASDDD